MPKIISTIIKVLILSIIETFLQLLYYTIIIKYFEPFMDIYDFSRIFMDGLKIVGSIKLFLFLPCYLIYYLFIQKQKRLIWVECIYHSILFLILFFILGVKK